MSDITIRKIRLEDNDKLARLIREVFHEFDAPKTGTVYSDPSTDNLFDLFQKEKSVLWVVENPNEVLGCCGVYPSEHLPHGCVELVKLYLSPKGRGKGLGKRLIEKSIQSAREMGYGDVYLESLPVFSTAIHIYEQLGFVHLDKPKGDSQHSSCNVWMHKIL